MPPNSPLKTHLLDLGKTGYIILRIRKRLATSSGFGCSGFGKNAGFGRSSYARGRRDSLDDVDTVVVSGYTTAHQSVRENVNSINVDDSTDANVEEVPEIPVDEGDPFDNGVPINEDGNSFILVVYEHEAPIEANRSRKHLFSNIFYFINLGMITANIPTLQVGADFVSFGPNSSERITMSFPHGADELQIQMDRVKDLAAEDLNDLRPTVPTFLRQWLLDFNGDLRQVFRDNAVFEPRISRTELHNFAAEMGITLDNGQRDAILMGLRKELSVVVVSRLFKTMN